MGGYYDYEVGACFPDEAEGLPDADRGFPYMERPSSVPEECWNDVLGTDWDCMSRDTLYRLLEAMWEQLFGESN